MYLGIYWWKLYRSYSIENLLQFLFCDTIKRVVLTQVILHQSREEYVACAWHPREPYAPSAHLGDSQPDDIVATCLLGNIHKNHIIN